MDKKAALHAETLAYYSGFGGIEIKGIENGVDDYVTYVSGTWTGKPKAHRKKIYYLNFASFFMHNGVRIYFSDCIYDF